VRHRDFDFECDDEVARTGRLIRPERVLAGGARTPLSVGIRSNLPNGGMRRKLLFD
jgi:hypothetical protein